MRCALPVVAVLLPTWAGAQAASGASTTSGMVAGPAASQPRFGFKEDTVRVEGSGDVPGVALLTADRLDEAMMAAALQGVDEASTTPAATTIRFDVGKAVELQKRDAGRTWHVPVTVAQLPINSDQQRIARVTIGGRQENFAYMLTNRPRTPVDFSVAMRDRWEVGPQRLATSVHIATRDQPVAGLHIALSKLSEQSTGTSIEAHAFELCTEPAGNCRTVDTIAPQSSRSLYLRLKEAHRRDGVFKGSIAFAADTRPEAKEVTLEIGSTSTWARLLGGIVIAISVALAWWVNVRGRLVVNRLSVLKLATAVRVRLEDLHERVAAFEMTTGIKLATLSESIGRKTRALYEQDLDAQGLLPSSWAFYRGYDEASLKAELGKKETEIKALTTLVRDGLEVIGQRWAQVSAAQRPQAAAAAAALDIDINGRDESAARSLVDAALAKLPKQSEGIVLETALLAEPARRTSALITAQIQSADLAAWWIYVALVFVGGVALLVLRAPGFGTWLDYVFCFFWGFGLPTALDRLQQLTPSGVSTAMSLTLPR